MSLQRCGRSLALCLLGLFAVHCSGTVGSSSPTPGSGPPTVAPGSTGVMPLRRLSRVEYQNTYKDLLGVDWTPGTSFGQVSGKTGFNEGSLLSGAELQTMYGVVDTLARQALSNSWGMLVPCDPVAVGESACAAQIITSFGRRAYRHALSPQEVQDLTGVYTGARAVPGNSFKDAVRVLVKSILMSPRFNYRWELGDSLAIAHGSLVALNSYEVASRLSYFLWQSTPDDALLDAADQGKLTDPAAVRAQAERMLTDPVRGPRGVSGFFAQWLRIDGLPGEDLTTTPTSYGPGLYTAMSTETALFTSDVLLGTGDHSLKTLLSGSSSFVNEQLANVYGVAGVTGPQFRRVAMDPSTRSGILTQASFLSSTYSSPLATPIQRGRFIYQRLAACAPISPPPAGVPAAPPPTAGMSVRQQLEAHVNDVQCAGCHNLMDPSGFALQGYDRFGRTRTQDEYGQPIITTGSLPSLGLSFTNAVDLSRQLAALPSTGDCMSDLLYGYAMRTPADSNELPSMKSLRASFAASHEDLRALMVSLTQSNAFYVRALAPGEVTQ